MCTPCTYRLAEFYCIQFNILYDIDRVKTVVTLRTKYYS